MMPKASLMNKEQELRPCPFCGGKAVLSSDHVSTVGTFYAGLCTGCGVRGAQWSAEATGIAAWNRRSSDEQAEVVGWMHPVWIGRLANGEISQPVLRPTNEGRSDLIPLYRAPPAVAAGGVTEEMVEKALYAVMPNGSTFIDWIAIPNKADLEEFGIDSKNYVLDIVRAQQQRAHAEIVVRLAIAAALPTPPSRGEGE